MGFFDFLKPRVKLSAKQREELTMIRSQAYFEEMKERAKEEGKAMAKKGAEGEY